MLTPQEVATHAFAKAVLNGYNMGMVDEFLEQVTDDYTALYKENAALKAKMKVMVEKVEEYRSTEESMRATLLTAQRMADSIVQEAEAKRDEILAQAQIDADNRVQSCQRDLAEVEQRIRSGRDELERFVATGKELFNREIQFLDELPRMTLETPPRPAAEVPAVQEIEERVMESFQQAEEPQEKETREAGAMPQGYAMPQGNTMPQGNPMPQGNTMPQGNPMPQGNTMPQGNPMPQGNTMPQGNPMPQGSTMGAAETGSEPPEDLRKTRRINLDELRFGRNLNSNTDQ